MLLSCTRLLLSSLLFWSSFLSGSSSFSRFSSSFDDTAYTTAALADRISILPLQDEPQSSNQFSGYLEVERGEKYLHYMYFESEGNPATDPVVLWTNGGPGCSGLLGLFTELGPWRPIRDPDTGHLQLKRNPYSWTRKANMLFVEQPAGVGFSYYTNNFFHYVFDDNSAAEDNMIFLEKFYEKFPERSKNELYLAAESYGGHYIPQLAQRILDSDSIVKDKLKGILVGNPYVSFQSGTVAGVNTLWAAQIVSRPTWIAYEALGCNDLNVSVDYFGRFCWDITTALEEQASNINPYAMYFPVCTRDNGYEDEMNLQLDRDKKGHKQVERSSSQQRLMKSKVPKSWINMKEEKEKENSYSSSAVDLKCQYLENTDYAPATWSLGTVEATTAEECCKACSEVAGCIVAPFYHGTCYLKAKKDIRGGRYEKEGVKTCVPYLRESVSRSYRGSGKEKRDFKGDPKRRLSSTGVGYGGAFTFGESSVDNPAVRYDACTEEYLVEYLNRQDVLEALHVDNENVLRRTHKWSTCDDFMFGRWPEEDFFYRDTTSVFVDLIKRKILKILIFSGDNDDVCATVATQEWVFRVGGKATKLWKGWYVDDQHAGAITQFDNSFTFVSVHTAGHEVPAYQPIRAYYMFEMYVDNNKEMFSSVPKSDENQQEEVLDLDMQYVYRQVAIAMSMMAAIVVIGYGMYWAINKGIARRRGGSGLTVRYDNSLQQNRGDLDVSVYREEVNNPMQQEEEEVISHHHRSFDGGGDGKNVEGVAGDLELSPLDFTSGSDSNAHSDNRESESEQGDDVISAEVSPYDGAIISQIVPTVEDDNEDEETIIL